MNCEYCGKEEALPFVCNYCGGAFCADHRLPEAHQCKGDLTQKRTIVAPPTTTFSWQQQPEIQPFPTTKTASAFSTIEIRDILVAWLTLGVAFALAFEGGGLYLIGSGISSLEVLFLVGVSLVTVGPGFVLHELAHKFVARRYGYWAEFRMWLQGLIVALVLSMISFLILAAPGATYISGTSISKSQNGWISVAGPLTNLGLALLFIPLTFYGGPVVFSPVPSLSAVGLVGLRVNSWLGAFNLVPFGPLDGAKVLRWNPMLWFVSLLSLGALVYFSFTI